MCFLFLSKLCIFFNTKINEFYHKNTIFFSRNLKEILWPESFYPKNLVIVSFCEQSILLIKKKWIRVGRKIILLLLLKKLWLNFQIQIWIFDWDLWSNLDLFFMNHRVQTSASIWYFTIHSILGTTIYRYDHV